MPVPHPPDPHSVAGKELHAAERCELLVGAAPAGLAAAIDPAGRGLQVMLWLARGRRFSPLFVEEQRLWRRWTRC